ncbi:outer membrane protein assembly factor BamB family protein [Rhodococcus tibetensis]|uniref:PQQ-like beta-propeller repeat protein n=1 Tax=Rhodococcus tibetensis TaxID=2965064 RepID=A0ABT1QI80_9NOCA|nr:PQQ-binding-like beta-propeller repeat protein [Rhodococcus sp. FXJ9.536]MCQ4121994.1 PQQ-like beta-propeller repeat protein [Rhodococcus sp. FXJ9.536]
MTIDTSTRTLLLAALTAVVTVAGAVTVVATHGADTQPGTAAPESSDSSATGEVSVASPDAPDSEWTLDAAATFGRQFAVFRSPAYETDFDSGQPGFLNGGEILVTMIGLVNQETGGLNQTELVGVDSSDGSVRWKTPIDNLGTCAEAALDGKVVCYSSPYEGAQTFSAIDIGTGEVTETARAPEDWWILGITVSGDRLFVLEGDPESDDIEVHSGSPSDPDANWSQRFDLGAAWEEAFGRIMTTEHGHGVLELGGEVAGFDLDNGRPTFTRGLPDCSSAAHATEGGVVVRVHSDCNLGEVLGSEAIDRTGRVIASTTNEAAHTLVIDRPTDDSTPLLLGDGGYDRIRGERLWTSAALLSRPETDSPESSDSARGTAVAVLGDVALLRDPAGGTESGLDLRTGEILWEEEFDDAGNIAAAEGSIVIDLAGDTLRGKDIRTGENVWTLPLKSVVDDGDAWDGSMALADSDAGLVYSTSHTMVCLSPSE